MNKLKELYLSQNSATVLENNGVYTIEDLYEKAKQ